LQNVTRPFDTNIQIIQGKKEGMNQSDAKPP